VRWVEIIGEAARSMSPELLEAHPQVPWRRIAAMRNLLVHAYFEIDADAVWFASPMSCRDWRPNSGPSSRGWSDRHCQPDDYPGALGYCRAGVAVRALAWAIPSRRWRRR
jgi:Ribonuclease HepT-like